VSDIEILRSRVGFSAFVDYRLRKSALPETSTAGDIPSSAAVVARLDLSCLDPDSSNFNLETEFHLQCPPTPVGELAGVGGGGVAGSVSAPQDSPRDETVPTRSGTVPGVVIVAAVGVVGRRTREDVESVCLVRNGDSRSEIAEHQSSHPPSAPCPPQPRVSAASNAMSSHSTARVFARSEPSLR